MNCSRLLAMLTLSLLALTLIGPASAQPVRAAAGKNDCVLTNDGHKVCDGGGAATAPARARLVDANGSPVATRSEGTIIGGRPAGCPHRYCGCGLRKYLGLADKRLNLASNWARLFPRVAGPRAGVAAVRSGHVMYIERSAGNGRWIVRDYNSGGGLSRLHVRSVRGYSFVNPHVALAQH